MEIIIKKDNENLNFVNGYAITSFSLPECPNEILTGVIDETGNIIINPSTCHSKILLLPNETAIIHTKDYSTFDGKTADSRTIDKDLFVIHVDLKSNNPMKTGVIEKLGKNYDFLPNGNIVVRGCPSQFYYEEDSNTPLSLDYIYNPIKRKMVSTFYPHIGEFQHDEKNDTYTAIITLAISEQYGYEVYGRIDMDGNLGKFILNSTDSLLLVRTSNFSLPNLISDTNETLRKRKRDLPF